MYKLIIAQKARKEVKALSQLLRGAVFEALTTIKEDPFSGKPLTRELSGCFVYKVGRYRIIYMINKKDKVVTVLTAGHRARIYD